MTYLDIVLIAVIQAVAGVLPLSASGHFALFSGLAGDPTAFAAVSVAAHLGGGLGLALWLWRDVLAMAGVCSRARLIRAGGCSCPCWWRRCPPACWAAGC